MKKGIATGVAALLLVGSISPTFVDAAAKQGPLNLLDENDKAGIKYDAETDVFVTPINVETLTMDEAVQYGLKSAYSLLELDYTLELLKENEDKWQDIEDVTESSLESALAKQKELQAKIDAATSADSATVDTSSPDATTIDTEAPSLTDELSNLLQQLDAIGIDVNEVETPEGTIITDTTKTDQDLRNTIKALQEFLNNIEIYLEEYEKYQATQLLQTQLDSVRATITSLSATLATAENTLDSYDLQITSLFNNRIISREQLQVAIESEFLGILMLQDQLGLLYDTVATEQTHLNANKVRSELGLISMRDYEKEVRSFIDLEKQIVDLKRQLDINKTKFALTIGIRYDEDYKLVRPEIGELALIEQQIPTEELVYDSLNMVNARTEVNQAEDQLDDVDDMPNRTKEDENIAEINVNLAKLKMESMAVSLEKQVNTIYHNVASQYQALENAARHLEEAKIDYQDLQMNYDLGLMSKIDYDTATLAVKNAELDYSNAQYQYYLTTKQVDLMEERVIPVQ